ncbi:tail fiber protein, partial [Flectobacillus sp. BAB-3569]|uniref:tail fiber protein n=1 Tax=Flectobacillus sp. BAB-3569 TaxID=1509483 RepID=UPI000BCD3CD0
DSVALSAYLPLTGGTISGKLNINAEGGTRLEEAKLCINTTNTNKPPSIAFHTPGVSAIQLYEKLGHLYIRNDNGTAYDSVNYKVWTQMNHGVDSGLNADLLDGYHASYFTDANNLVTNANRRLVSDTQVSYWNGKVDRTELAAFLPLSGGTMTGAIRFNAAGSNNGISAGTGDGATTTAYNLEIASWYGVGFKSTLDNTTKIVFDTRAGRIQASRVLLSDFADGQIDRLVVSQGDGSLVRSDKVRFGYNNHISVGTGDNATESTYNFEIASWWGIGFKSNVDNTTRIVFDTRAGRVLSKAVRVSDFADGTNAVPVISDANGNLVKSAFSADWVNTNANRRFVTDTQVGQWNNKVERSELGAYLPLSGGYLSGKLEIHGTYGTHWSESKLVVLTTDNTKPPSICFHTPNKSTITIYEKDADLFIRSDMSEAGASIHKRIWSENNHGIGSGLNADLLDGFHASYFTDANNLITNANKRLVSDSQVAYWNGKVDSVALSAYLPLTGGTISGKLNINAEGGTRLEEAKLCINTTNTNKPPSIAFHTPGVSAIQLYEKLGHLYIRNDNGTAYDSVNYKVWTQMNHGVDSGLNADLLDGYHASYFTDANNLITNSSKRLVSDAQMTYWNSKVDKTELDSYLALSGGTMTGAIRFSGVGVNSIGYGTGDGATTSTYNLQISSWYGIGFRDTCYGNTYIVFDTRAGRILTKAVRISDFADGQNAVPVISDSNGNLTKSAFSADWINTTGNKRFVTDTQITYWNGKADRAELGAYLPLTGGFLTGKLEIQSNGGTHWSDSKLVVVTTDNTKHPSITLHSPGNSAVTIYQKTLIYLSGQIIQNQEHPSIIKSGLNLIMVLVLD